MSGSSASVLTLLCFVLVCFLVSPPPTQAAETCGRLLAKVSSCVGYVQRGGTLPPSCCDALKNLNAATTKTADLQAACVCLKSLAPAFGVNAYLINGLPDKCGINFPYRYSPSLDCSKLHR